MAGAHYLSDVVFSALAILILIPAFGGSFALVAFRADRTLCARRP